jgi:hypothetical protein
VFHETMGFNLGEDKLLDYRWFFLLVVVACLSKEVGGLSVHTGIGPQLKF